MTTPCAHLIRVARGEAPADLLLRNARLVNVFTGRIESTDVALAGGRVAGFGDYRAERVLDLRGRYLAPGFIDAHVHLESAMVSPAQFARAVLPHGTTAVVADPHEIANVLGLSGLDYMFAASADQPFSFYFTLSSCVPATHMETSGARLSAADLAPLMKDPRVVGLAEVMNFPGVIAADPEVLAKIAGMRALGKAVDGHAPGLGGKALCAYLAAGIGSDHECSTLAEAREKLAAGMHIMVREGTAARNLDALLPLVDAQTAQRMMWCSDDRHPQDLLAEGHIDSILRRAVAQGLDPVTAIRMATLTPAEYFRLPGLGGVAPGRRADLVVLDDLARPTVRQVFVAGQLVAEEGELVAGLSFPATPKAPTSMRVPLDRLDFRLPAAGERLRVIEASPEQLTTGAGSATPCVRNGLAVADPARDLLKLVVVERHRGSGATGITFIRGFGLKRGALASTVAHDSHNIVAVGTSDAELLLAVKSLVAGGGGMVAVAAGEVLARVDLPIAGLMTDQPVEVVRDRFQALVAAARTLGATLPDPFMTLGFMALPVIPSLKLTDQGLVDVERFEIVSPFC
ncbi:adenine deaminase [Desulfuromonas carbonis]|uniref:adenine deaminase n=1 Tax=Desulfuromonas sp. DDH964 TaxID=1823759 RepID=UPI00078DA6C2|nr:adenine deaminase [Desulfuromonas sp. DDH964]AMV71124.1 Adenine deaminase [Desulfuromonas sp. DDH964]